MEAKSATNSNNVQSTPSFNSGTSLAKTNKGISTAELESFPAQSSKTGAIEKNLVNRNDIVAVGLNKDLATKEAAAFNYNKIQGVTGNKFVTPEFISGVEGMAKRIGTKPEYIMGVMSFETGGTFDPAKKNGIGATGLIQFLPSTANGLGTTTDKLAKMTSTEQLKYVEKYFDQPAYKGKLGTLEGLYTSVLSGTARSNKDDVLFRSGTKAYNQNPLDWNRDGKITAAEAVTPVAAKIYGGVKAVQQKLVDGGFVPANQLKGFADDAWGKNTSTALSKFQQENKLPATGLLDDATGKALFGTTTNNPPTPPTGNILKPGSNGAAVDTLQNDLIDLGFMSKDQKATGAGTFGPRTESALKAFQEKARVPVTGTFTPETQKAMKDITSALGRTTTAKNEGVTKGIQDRLVELGYMTSQSG